MDAFQGALAGDQPAFQQGPAQSQTGKDHGKTGGCRERSRTHADGFFIDHGTEYGDVGRNPQKGGDCKIIHGRQERQEPPSGNGWEGFLQVDAAPGLPAGKAAGTGGQVQIHRDLPQEMDDAQVDHGHIHDPQDKQDPAPGVQVDPCKAQSPQEKIDPAVLKEQAAPAQGDDVGGDDEG